MNVLSLFDGISCGQIALNRAGIKYDSYFASEIDKHAIKVTQSNYPNTIQQGSVLDVKAENLPKIDLLLGGSPCQSFSFEGKQEGFEGKSGLFYEYVRLLKETQPKYFLLENVMMKKEWEDTISEILNIKPIKINSKLVSAQNRNRLYWTNIPNISQLNDKNLLLKDIIDNDSKYEYWSDMRMSKFHNKEYVRKDTYRVLNLESKIPCLTVRAGHGGSDEPKLFHNDKLRRLTPLEWERAQTLPDNYTNILNSNNIRRGCIGNGWTVDVIVHILSHIPIDKNNKTC